MVYEEIFNKVLENYFAKQWVTNHDITVNLYQVCCDREFISKRPAYCIDGNICPRFFFSPLSLALSADEFKTEWIPMPQIISSIRKCVWAN